MLPDEAIECSHTQQCVTGSRDPSTPVVLSGPLLADYARSRWGRHVGWCPEHQAAALLEQEIEIGSWMPQGFQTTMCWLLDPDRDVPHDADTTHALEHAGAFT
ncbi:hypothetical protein NDU88_002469 [Pleurodeles waltl]|uniref:Uncharacterized protein n=1 Tax=Pleurodeles waltl TaxID=8319 RepID=A0AAV7MMR5_PLEWA|nr:hypothetical protein NDU88_002469 [Pleurodeles waltl]